MPIQFVLFTLCLLLPISALARSPVWLIERDDHKLYLAGTVHLLRADDYPLPQAYEVAYRKARHLVFELDLEDSRSREFQMLTIEAMRLPPGTQLSALIKPDTLQKLELQLHKHGLDLARFSGTKPAMIAMTLTVLELQRMGVGSAGVDEHFYNRARADNKRISALETADEQIQMLASMGQGHEDEMMRQTLEELESLQDEFGHMLSAWRSGDRQRLEKLFIEPMKQDFSESYEELLVERNDKWLPKIRRMLKTGEVEMVLVGSAHLVGKDGLLQRLEGEGYKISQLD
jgi:uncharacterized protein YbaP (TraB family)